MSFGPLKNLKVFEFSGIGPGPFLGMILADFGAEVIKIEKFDNSGDMFCNRGKKSFACDLKKTQVVELILKMLKDCDVIIDPYRPGVMEKLGLGPNDCLIVNPRIIYARLTGFGQNGPYSLMAGHDTNYVAVSGVLSKLGRKDEVPSPPGNLLADFAGGTFSCLIGILMCLHEREQSGKGQVIDNAMQDGVLYLSSFIWETSGTNLWNNERGKNVLDSGSPFYEVYETKDEKFFSVGALEPQFYKIFIQKIEIPEYANSQYDIAKWPEMKKRIQQKFKTKTREEWQSIFDNTDACAVPVVDFKDIMKHPHNKHRRALIEYPNTNESSQTQSDKTKNIFKTHSPRPAPRLSRTPGRDYLVERAALGEHTRSILIDNGINEREIEQLILSKCILCKERTSKL